MANFDDVVRIRHATIPRKLGNVHQTFDATQIDKRTDLVDIANDCTLDARPHFEIRHQFVERIFFQTLHRKRQLVLALRRFDRQNVNFHILTDFEHLFRRFNMRVRNLRNVNQAFQATHVDKRTVILNRNDFAVQNRTDFDLRHELFALDAVLFILQRRMRKDDIVPTLRILDDFEFERLTDKRIRIFDFALLNLRKRAKCSLSHDFEFKTTLIRRLHERLHRATRLIRFFERNIARFHRTRQLNPARIATNDLRLDRIADDMRQFAIFWIEELRNRQRCLRLCADVHIRILWSNLYDNALDDHALFERLRLHRLLILRQKCRKIFDLFYRRHGV